MFVRVLATDGDAHPPEAWSAVTAETIFPLSPDITPERRVLAMKVQTAIAEALVEHHGNNQLHVRNYLQGNHPGVLLNAEYHADAAIDAIVKVAKGSPWEAHWLRHETQERAKRVIVEHMQTAQYIEHLWWNEDSERARLRKDAIVNPAKVPLWKRFLGRA